MKTNPTSHRNLICTFSIMGTLLSGTAVLAQQTDSTELMKKNNQRSEYPKNNVKINLSSLAINNYSFYVERLLSRKVSFSAGYRNMPSTNLGELSVIKKISDKINEGEELIAGINRMRVDGKAYTGEFRFYGGKKQGARGMYLALYGRYATFNHDYNYRFTNSSNNVLSVPLKSKVKGYGGGLMIGKQWLIAKRVNLDFYWLGGHYGKLSGTTNAVADLSSLSQQDQRNLKDELDNILTVGDKTFLNSTVSNKGVTGNINGPFAGLRGLGFSVGIAF